MSRLRNPQLSFADLQLQSLGVELDPVLRRVSALLDEQDALIELVRQDLNRGLKKPSTGRNGMAPDQVLHSWTLMRIKNWDYRELRERINDGYTLRGFTHFDGQSVPKHDAFNRAFNRITPATLRTINQMVIQAAVDLGMEDGAKLRVDTTVVETNIHYPTDATLLWDSVRTVTRLVGSLDEELPQGVPGFTNRSQSAQRRMQELERMTPQQREKRQKETYRELIQITGQVTENARQVVEKTKTVQGIDGVQKLVIQQLGKEILDYCEVSDKVMDQTRRRVLEGEDVPTDEKVYSIFELHTDLIKRGKARKLVEFGHKVFLAESARGLITDYQVLEGNPYDADHVAGSLERHKQMFGHVPESYNTDRGFFSPENVTLCEDAKVKEVCIPQRGGQKSAEQAALERSAWFRKGQRFRAGIEGRISVLFRGRGMKRCLAHGEERFEIWVGAAVLANNLLKIAQWLEEGKPKLKSKAA